MIPKGYPRTRHGRHAHHHKGPHATGLSAAPVKNEINVTPLVDVVLVLLIIFMVVTPMLSRGVKVELPETLHHEKKQDTGEQIVVTVQAGGHTFVDTDRAEGEQLVERIKLALRTNGGREVHVKADRALQYGVVRRVLERIHEAGAPTVALGTAEHKDKEEP